MIIYFFIGEVLGKGGFGEVFKAKQIISANLSSEPISSTTVAVKESSLKLYEKEPALRRIRLFKSLF